MKRLSIMRKKEIEKQAKSLLEQYGYPHDDSVHLDIVKFVRKYGFTVGNATLSDEEDGFLICGPDQKIIGVNADRSYEMKRFIIAHEFAHSILHMDPERTILHRHNRKGKDKKENDADYFAAALLMPIEAFEKAYECFKKKGLTDNIIWLQLSVLFVVPLESVVRRIEEMQDLKKNG